VTARVASVTVVARRGTRHPPAPRTLVASAGSRARPAGGVGDADTKPLVGPHVARDGLRPFANLPTVRQAHSVAVDVVGTADGLLQLLTP
jgi:hypothetical protein